jgi:hypothetical protein
LATIPDGVDVSDFLARLGLAEDAWVNAVGTVSGAELALAGEGGEVTRAVESTATLISLLGPARGPLMAVLASAEAGIHAGRLTRAVSGGVVFTVMNSAPNPAGAAPAPATALPAGAGTSTAPARLVDEEADELPLQGDRIDHFVFGLCDVMVVTGERFKIREVGGGKLREIHVGPFRLSKPVVRDGKRVFKLVKRS